VRALALQERLPAAVSRVIELLTSELVANAVVHGGGPTVTIAAGRDGDHFRVAVTDSSDELPVVRTSAPDVPGGHGMRLVDRLAESWGVDRGPDGGKTVWFRVATAGAS
jgi:anti-sigma regulatory factor (Ser/Thr protein kinase)